LVECLPVGERCKLFAISFTGISHSVINTPIRLGVLRKEVCRDFAHLAITFCRCLNIPARYCTGYLGDICVPSDPSPMDFSAWFEAFIGGQWYTFDARHKIPRVGRVLIARGRDAADVAISTTFGRTRELDEMRLRPHPYENGSGQRGRQ
jgi:transglutaminase-like putative cysteine protease